MDFDGLKELGSGLGTAGVIVMDKSTDVVAAIARIWRLLALFTAAFAAPLYVYGALLVARRQDAERCVLHQVVPQHEDAPAWP